MTTSIIVMFLIGAMLSAIAAAMANIMRAAELRELRRELKRFEKSFPTIRVVEDPKVIRKTKSDESGDLPKFGDE